MWSKIRKKLINMLPKSLDGKIDFQMSSYRFGWRSHNKGHQLPTITILYEDNIVLGTYKYAHYQNRNDIVYDTDKFIMYFNEYINMKASMFIENNIYFRIFMLLDGRIGKRTLLCLIDEYKSCNNVELKRLYEISFWNEGLSNN